MMKCVCDDSYEYDCFLVCLVGYIPCATKELTIVVGIVLVSCYCSLCIMSMLHTVHCIISAFFFARFKKKMALTDLQFLKGLPTINWILSRAIITVGTRQDSAGGRCEH